MSPVVDRESRVRIQAMLEASTAELVKAEALRKGVSISAMAGMLIKAALDADTSIEASSSSSDMDHRIKKILEVAEREGLI